MIPIHIVVAIDAKRGIGKDAVLPWELSKDMNHFRETTSLARSPKKRNVVVMGRKTWESIPSRFRPLAGRMNIVLTRNKWLDLPDEVLRAESFDKVIEMAKSDQLKNIIETIFVIGGQQIYEEALKYSECEKLYVTHVHSDFSCDAFFPPFEDAYESLGASEPLAERGITFHFEEYARKNL